MVRTAEGKTETPRTGRKTSELRKRLQYSPRRFGHAWKRWKMALWRGFLSVGRGDVTAGTKYAPNGSTQKRMISYDGNCIWYADKEEPSQVLDMINCVLIRCMAPISRTLASGIYPFSWNLSKMSLVWRPGFYAESYVFLWKISFDWNWRAGSLGRWYGCCLLSLLSLLFLSSREKPCSASFLRLRELSAWSLRARANCPLMFWAWWMCCFMRISPIGRLFTEKRC